MTWPSETLAAKRARIAVYQATKSGALARRPCEVCGSTKRIEGHHEDYSKPLDVRWLCRLHHSWLHKYGESIKQMQDARDRVAV